MLRTRTLKTEHNSQHKRVWDGKKCMHIMRKVRIHKNERNKSQQEKNPDTFFSRSLKNCIFCCIERESRMEKVPHGRTRRSTENVLAWLKKRRKKCHDEVLFLLTLCNFLPFLCIQYIFLLNSTHLLNWMSPWAMQFPFAFFSSPSALLHTFIHHSCSRCIFFPSFYSFV